MHKAYAGVCEVLRQIICKVTLCKMGRRAERIAAHKRSYVVLIPLPPVSVGFMRELAVLATPDTEPELPALIARAGQQAAWRFLEFFTVHIRNPTRGRLMRALLAPSCAGARGKGSASSARSSRCRWPPISRRCR
jgi:hypothetical protein